MRWCLIHTKPACEAVAQTNLERQGYRVYYPRLLRLGRIRGRWVGFVVPSRSSLSEIEEIHGEAERQARR